MSALAAVPGLSSLLAWPTEHLTEAADYWEAAGGRCYGVASQVWRDALSIDWQGEAADTLRSATHFDMMTTSAVADQMHEAAKVARSGASDLYAVRSRVRYAVEDARAAGFEVGEDLSVTDCMTGGSAAQRAARQAQAQSFAGDIGQRAAQLVSLDQQVAGKVTAAVAGIRHTFPQNPNSGIRYEDNRVHAVDHRTFKQDPPPPGVDPWWENQPPPKTAQDVRDALEQLRRGKRKPHRELDTPEEIRSFYKWLSAGSVRDSPNSAGFPRKVLQDGTGIKLRPDSDSGGPTIEVEYPDGGKIPKVHLPMPPIVTNDPELPEIGLNPPVELPSLPTGHPPPAVLPPTQFADPAGLPPWLKDPSPPGFHISPVQQPPAFDWDRADPPSAPLPQPAAVAPDGSSSWLPEIGHDLSEAGEKTFEWLVIAGVLAGGVLGVGGQRREVPAP